MTDTRKSLILIIEDEPHIAEGLRLNLSLQGYGVEIAEDGSVGMEKWRSLSPDLIVLDIMLPVMDGISVLKAIRQENERVPILILSAKNASGDKIKGLSCGVDDYMTKPFNLEEFLLRVERLLLRSAWSSADKVGAIAELAEETYRFGDNEIRFSTMTAVCGVGEVHLTDLEIRLLRLFIANRGRPLSRGEILESVWGYDRSTSTRTVDNFIVRFRKYFEKDPKDPVFFKSVRSVGYVFESG